MEISEELAKALGVDVSPEQAVARIELILEAGEPPKLLITRYLLPAQVDAAAIGIARAAAGKPWQ